MRVGLLADVHANLPALDAALRRLAAERVEAILVAGDLVGYGASPNECVERLAQAGAVCVAGNHDLFVLDRLPPTRFSAQALRAAEVTRGLLSEDTRSFLADLPAVRRFGPLVMAHGSLDDPEEYVEDRMRVLELLRTVAVREPGAHTLVLGHTHHQRHVHARATASDGQRMRFVNPGSVGQSRARERRPRVRLAVMETDAGRPRFLRIDYDAAAALERLAALGLGEGCLHATPELTYRIGHRLPRPVRTRVKHLRSQLTRGGSNARR